MRMSSTARMRYPALGVLACSALLVGCAGESTAPVAAPRDGSTLEAADASRSLVGATDGSYTFTVNPSRDQTLAIGASSLVIPAHAICRLADSKYGAAYWNEPCAAETAPVVITAVVRDASTDHPRIDFEPAMRFAPKQSVQLYMSVDQRPKKSAWNILYCASSFSRGCVDESLSDKSLDVKVKGSVVTRRIKHFSGYVVTNRGGDDIY